MSEQVDRFGTVASSICAIHCAVCAILPAAFSSLGLGFLLGHQAEWVFTLIAVAFAVGALALGWPRHRSPRVAALLGMGILGLFASRGLEMGSEGHDHDHGIEVSVAAHGHEADEAHEEAGHDEHEGHRMEDAMAHKDEHGHHGTPHTSGHDDGHHEGGDGLHMAGTGVGVLGGLLLFLGHLFNIRASRRQHEDCCE